MSGYQGSYESETSYTPPHLRYTPHSPTPSAVVHNATCWVVARNGRRSLARDRYAPMPSRDRRAVGSARREIPQRISLAARLRLNIWREASSRAEHNAYEIHVTYSAHERAKRTHHCCPMMSGERDAALLRPPPLAHDVAHAPHGQRAAAAAVRPRRPEPAPRAQFVTL